MITRQDFSSRINKIWKKDVRKFKWPKNKKLHKIFSLLPQKSQQSKSIHIKGHQWSDQETILDWTSLAMVTNVFYGNWQFVCTSGDTWLSECLFLKECVYSVQIQLTGFNQWTEVQLVKFSKMVFRECYSPNMMIFACLHSVMPSDDVFI